MSNIIFIGPISTGKSTIAELGRNINIGNRLKLTWWSGSLRNTEIILLILEQVILSMKTQSYLGKWRKQC
ncbi:hypothetical protein SAMN05518848_102666 [Paenibacillus sp. PDC88]|nr:hypothetical protein SAMN05518848_102666 [Paenibacillus sp. PDC88]